MMEGFDTMAMHYIPGTLQSNGMQHVDYMSAASGMDLQDRYSNFDTEACMSADETAFTHSNGLGHPTLKRYESSAFEDPFADPTMAQFDHIPPDLSVPGSPSIDRDNKLLGFSMPLYNFTLLDYSLRRTSLNMTAQLHGMFFLAESQWPATPDAPPPPPELTCYRRNLFQITGSVTLPRTLRYIMTDQGDRIPILAQELTISATESVENNSVKIISVPWKTSSGGATGTADEKVEKEPPSIPLDTMAGQDLDADYASFPIQWKRLQFRIATANNGRRKELQQHFVIRLKVLATLSTGAKISIAEAHSGAIIVRGRSPRNFQSRKDYPLGNGANSSRKHVPTSVSRTSTGESIPQTTPAQKQVKSPPDEVPPMVFQYENNDIPTQNSDLVDWQHQGVAIPDSLPAPAYSTSMIPPTMSYSNQPSPDLMFANPNLAGLGFPINLSFSDEEGSPVPQSSKPNSRPPTSNPSPNLMHKSRAATITSVTSPTVPNPPKQRPRLNSQRPASSTGETTAMSTAVAPPESTAVNVSAAKLSSLNPIIEDSTDHLYEYFPLGLDDWMPPVDAVYRPHIVHHTGPLPTDAKATAAGRARSKRYFAEDG